MSAKEMWTFVLSFGLMMGDRVSLNDPVWQFYLILRQIVCLRDDSKSSKRMQLLTRYTR